ncbi:MAG: hypothetical protein HY928_00230 [Elusimicrobia bacterium]|nr:hypothetical protein [Elusimicrobiota bacterium]
MGTLFALLRLTLAAAAMAGPSAVNWQGRLSDPATGNPVTAPTAQVTFRIYDASSGGSLLWSEGPRTLTVDNGQVDARMGEVTALSSAVFAGSGRWLEVEVNGSVLSPREAFASAPWSLRAQTADFLASGTTNYIQNRDTLQTGASAFPSSGSVNGTLTVYGLVHLAGDLRVRGSLRAGTANHTLTTGSGLWDAAKFDPATTVPNEALDDSSVTKLGNAFNGPDGLVVLDGSGYVPASLLDPAVVTQQGNTFNAASKLLKLDAGALVPNALVDASSVVKVSPSGLIHNYLIDATSITLQGNSFNAANKLLRADSGGLVDELYLDASSVSKRSSTGLVHNYQLDSASITLQGNTFNAAGKLVKLDANAVLNAPASGNAVYGVVTSSSINVGGSGGRVHEAGFVLVPKEAIVIWAGAVCPPGWSEAAEFQGRVPIGVCSGCLVGLTAGTAFTTNSQAQTHDHSMGSADPAGTAWRDTGTRRTDTKTTTMPYRQMLYCRKDQ